MNFAHRLASWLRITGKREGKQLFLHTFAFGWGLVFKPTLPFRFTSILNTYLLQLANLLLNKDLLNRLS